MSSLTDLTNETRPRTIKMVSILYAYAIGLALLYEGSFWATFHINIMQYTSLSDLPKVAIFPLLNASVSQLLTFAFQAFITLIALTQDTKSKKDVLDEKAPPSQIPNHIETGGKRSNISRVAGSRLDGLWRFLSKFWWFLSKGVKMGCSFIVGSIACSYQVRDVSTSSYSTYGVI